MLSSSTSLERVSQNGTAISNENAPRAFPSRYSHILAPTSMEKRDRAALILAMEMAALHRARLTVFHVIDPNLAGNSFHWLDGVGRLYHDPLLNPLYTGDEIEISQRALSSLQRHVEEIMPEHLRSGFELRFECRTGDVAECIARYARDAAADLVIMSSGTRRWWSAMLRNSARRVLQLTRQPVILVRPSE